MIILQIVMMMLLLISPVYATLTVGNVPVTKTSGSSPVVQDSVITSLTNVGIGSTAPGVKLDVQGNVRASGTLVASNFSGTSSGTNTGDQTNITGNAATVTTNANLTGEVTSVGNAAVLGSFASSSLLTALTNETGSGVAVFGTGPTISNPITTNISPGADFSITQNSVLPFKSINSGATVNTLVLRTGNVGVGSLTPGTTLDVTGTVRASTDVKIGTKSLCQSDGTNCPADTNTNYWSLSPGNVGIYTVAGQNVGVGSASPTQSLDVIGTVKADTYVVTGVSTGTFYGPSGFQWDPNNSSGSGIIPAMTMLSTGNVGIGTSGSGSPNSPFYVKGRTFLSNINGNSLVFDLNGANFGLWYNKSADSTLFYGASSDITSTPTTAILSLGTDSSNVGIGTNIAPSKLYVGGTIRTQGFRLDGNGVAAGNVLVSNSVGVGTWMSPSSIGASGGSTSPGGGNNAVQYNSGGSFAGDATKLSFNGSNVGIGTTSGTASLVIQKSGNTDYLHINTSASAGGDLVTIKNGGNIGINSTAPGVSLDVQGNFRVSGIIAASGTLVASNFSGTHSGTSSGTNTGDQTNISGNAATVTTNANLTGSDVTSVGNAATLNSTWKGWSYASPNVFLSTSTNNVGIGTIVPMAVLNINSAAAQDLFRVDDSAGSDTTPFIIDSTGNVGVGSAQPSASLAISSTLAQTLFRVDDNGTGDLSPFIIDANGNVGIGTTNTERDALLVMGGNVGIGTWVPSTKLDIAGVTVTVGLISTGNVGVNSLTPGAILDVQGLTRINATSGNIANMTNGATSEFSVTSAGVATANAQIVSGGTNTQSTILDGLVVNSGQVTSANGGDFKVLTNGSVGIGTYIINATTGNIGIGTLAPQGAFVIKSSVTGIGWAIKSQANQACNTTCIHSCVFGEDTSVVGTLVACTDATADICLCAGPT